MHCRSIRSLSAKSDRLPLSLISRLKSDDADHRISASVFGWGVITRTADNIERGEEKAKRDEEGKRARESRAGPVAGNSIPKVIVLQREIRPLLAFQ